MMKEELLFVTNATNEWDEGFSYVLELAQTLKARIAVLMVQPKNTYEEMMVAMTLAEGGVPEMAKDHLLSGQEKRLKSAILSEQLTVQQSNIVYNDCLYCLKDIPIDKAIDRQHAKTLGNM